MKKGNNMAIVKYDNNLNTLALKNFTSVEMDLLMSLCSKVRDEDTKEITLRFEQLKELSSYSSTSKERFINDLSHTNEKLLNLRFKIQDSNRITQFVLFPTFELDLEEETLTVSVNQKFTYILNQLESNFTRFELEEFASLKSTYSKSLYRLLKQFRHSGVYRVSVEDFRILLDVPTTYNNAIMNREVLNVAMKELKKCFSELKVEKIKKGRNIIAFEFRFKPEKTYAEKKQQVVDKRKTFLCRECGRPLIWKTINGNEALCHADGWKSDAVCNRIYNSVAEATGLKELPGREARHENRGGGMSNLSDILGNYFEENFDEDE